ncbi:MAG: hypothetical protein KatS3mg087_1836 [Patescibacteria group bacterium]|nr:MAG: hypothetical protein KatS3mg087_1836 [Patescibacteria group bacterium]
MNPRDYGLEHDSWYPGQIESIQWAIDPGNSGKARILESPTGTKARLALHVLCLRNMTAQSQLSEQNSCNQRTTSLTVFPPFLAKAITHVFTQRPMNIQRPTNACLRKSGCPGARSYTSAGMLWQGRKQ